MAKNKMNDLRDHLFAQLERLGDDESMKNPIARDREVARAKSIVDVSHALLESAKVEIQYLKATDSFKTESPMFQEMVQQLPSGTPNPKN